MSDVRIDTAPAGILRCGGRPSDALADRQLAGFIALLDVSIVNVALPSIERGLAVSGGSVLLVLAIYVRTPRIK